MKLSRSNNERHLLKFRYAVISSSGLLIKLHWGKCAIKYLGLFVVLSCNLCFGQNIVKTINISPGENSVTSSLPFDRPIILKWTSKEPVVVTYAGLVKIKKGTVNDYYQHWAQKRSFFELDNGEKRDNVSAVSVEKLVTTYTVNADGKYELNLFISPLAPNKFYDVKILRRPIDLETSLYYDLFSSIENAPVFERKLRYINSLKAPFRHIYLSGADEGKLMIAELQEFYDVFLKSYYQDIKVNSADKDKVAAATAKIKATLVNDLPPNAFDVAGNYIGIFNASSDASKDKAINDLAVKLTGYVHSEPKHVGLFDRAGLNAIYSADTTLKELVASYNAADDKTKPIFQGKIMDHILQINLPVAEDMFVFGQTFSSTTAVLDFDTRTTFTITPDFGFVYYGIGQRRFQDFLPYVGFQLEFRYFDKNIPFNLIRPKSFWHYLSFTSGLSLASIKKEGKRDDFFANKSLLLGLGWRLTSATRITFGGLLFRKEDINPLIDSKKLAATPFIGLSIDLKLKSILNDFYGLTSTKKP